MFLGYVNQVSSVGENNSCKRRNVHIGDSDVVNSGLVWSGETCHAFDKRNSRTLESNIGMAQVDLTIACSVVDVENGEYVTNSDDEFCDGGCDTPSPHKDSDFHNSRMSASLSDIYHVDPAVSRTCDLDPQVYQHLFEVLFCSNSGDALQAHPKSDEVFFEDDCPLESRTPILGPKSSR